MIYDLNLDISTMYLRTDNEFPSKIKAFKKVRALLDREKEREREKKERERDGQKAATESITTLRLNVCICIVKIKWKKSGALSDPPMRILNDCGIRTIQTF